MYTAMDRDGLIASVERINRELHSQYLLGYMPSSVEHDGKWRKLNITVRKSPECQSFTSMQDVAITCQRISSATRELPFYTFAGVGLCMLNYCPAL
jgi:hypothetical protein